MSNEHRHVSDLLDLLAVKDIELHDLRTEIKELKRKLVVLEIALDLTIRDS